MAEVKAICISEKKGVRKHEVDKITVSRTEGIIGDAHGEDPKRQVSFLGTESVDKLREALPTLAPGDFAENILTEGLTLYELPVGTRLTVGETLFEVTQIGKECHQGCEIRRITGDCVMPREGVFARVIKEGDIRKGDRIEVEEAVYEYNAAVITVSDKGSTGEREDKGGPKVCELLNAAGIDAAYTGIIPDEQEQIEKTLKFYADEKDVALIVTTGGTGFGMRDVTPEATAAVCDRLVPGIPEAMRYESLKITKRAMLSRMIAGIRGRTLIINLPGSPKAISENLNAVIDALPHGIEVLRGPAADCAESEIK